MILQNNTILITGGSSGIGLELAGRLTVKNNVLICGRSETRLKEAAKKYPDLAYLPCDLSQSYDRQRLIQWVTEKHPDCNVLINNAALVHREDFYAGEKILEKAELEIQTNLMGPIALVKGLIPVLEQNANPRIINITTGLVYAPKAAYPFYNATKAALHSFTQVLRMQLSTSVIAIHEVLFPAVDTPWHAGNPPKIAISAKIAVDEMIGGLEKNRPEIKVGKVKLLHWLTRIAPSVALKKINSV